MVILHSYVSLPEGKSINTCVSIWTSFGNTAVTLRDLGAARSPPQVKAYLEILTALERRLDAGARVGMTWIFLFMG